MIFRDWNGDIHIGDNTHDLLISMAHGCLIKEPDLIKHFGNVILAKLGVRLKPDATESDIFCALEDLHLIQELEQVNVSKRK